MKKDSSIYRESLHFSWRFLWEHKILWIFGLFAAFLGQMGITEFVGNILRSGNRYSTVGLVDIFSSLFALPSIVHFSFTGWALYGWLLIVLLVIFLGIGIVAIISQGALVHAVAQSGRKKDPVHRIHVGAAWHAGIHHFWRIAFVHIVKKLFVILFTCLVGFASATVVITGLLFDQILFILLFLFTVGIGIILYSLAVYAVGYIVVEEYGVIPAIRAAWKLFVDHWLVSLEIGCLLLLLNVFLLFLIFFGFLIVSFHGAFVWVFSLLLHSPEIIRSLLFLETFVLFVFIIFLGSTFTVFSTALWTHLFMHMHKHGIRSHVIRLFHNT